MEGVGARQGRSSSRYGTTTIFSGPVRKWKKNWVAITPPPSNNNNHHHNHSNGSINGASSSSSTSASHLRFYKWTPLSKDTNTNNSAEHSTSPNDTDKDEKALLEEPPRRKFKFVPVAVLEEQKKEDEEISEDEANHADADEGNRQHASKKGGYDEKPDINDLPMEDSQGSEENQAAPTRQDLNELDLSLGLTSHDEELDSDSKTEPNEDAEPNGAKV